MSSPDVARVCSEAAPARAPSRRRCRQACPASVCLSRRGLIRHNPRPEPCVTSGPALLLLCPCQCTGPFLPAAGLQCRMRVFSADTMRSDGSLWEPHCVRGLPGGLQTAHSKVDPEPSLPAHHDPRPVPGPSGPLPPTTACNVRVL